MFSFLNTLEILPVDQVHFIDEVLRECGVDAAVMLKAKVGMPGFISVNAWTAHAEPLCCTVATEVVCGLEARSELRRILEEFCQRIQAAAKPRIKAPGQERQASTTALDAAASEAWRLGGFTCDGAS